MKRQTRLWTRYIQWVDRDIDARLPGVNSWSSAVPLLPLLPVMLWMAVWEPQASTRMPVVGVAAALSAVLCAIWVWRLVYALVFRPPGTQPAEAMIFDVTRDSVAAGDDADAPHRHGVTVTKDASLIDLAKAILAEPGYLASIAGGSATWYIRHDAAAVVFGECEGDRFLLPVGKADDVGAAPKAVHVHYAQQTPPDELIRRQGAVWRSRAFK